MAPNQAYNVSLVMRAMQINVRESTRNLSLTRKNAFASFMRIETEILLME
jgi:hypothetical protein